MDRKKLVTKITKSIYSLSVLDESNSAITHGTAFAISKDILLTAFHIVEESGINDEKLIVKSSRGEILEATVIDNHPEFDLLVLRIKENHNNPSLTAFQDIPFIGEQCFWGGYPVIVGVESTRRLRFAQGMISSSPFGQHGNFFEVDGTFSPGHSGAPILECTDGHIIGCVSRSVGDPQEYFQRHRRYLDTLNAIQPLIGMPSEMLGILRELSGLRMSLQLPTERWEFDYHDENGLSERYFPNRPALNQIMIDTLKEVGINVSILKHRTISGKPKETAYVEIQSYDNIMMGTIRLILNLTDALEDAIGLTYQMGIGVASGGKPLQDIITNYQ